MKRFHVHLGVADLDQSIRFYSGLFGAPPTVQKDDYAKWMIEDPRVNFAISTRNGEIGVDHLGLQADSVAELATIREQFSAADNASVQDEPGANCCYAKSDKHWVTDPQGIAWEGYHTLGEIRYFSGDDAGVDTATACCTTETPTAEKLSAGCCSQPKASLPRVVPATASACCSPTQPADEQTATTARCCG